MKRSIYLHGLILESWDILRCLSHGACWSIPILFLGKLSQGQSCQQKKEDNIIVRPFSTFFIWKLEKN